MMNSGNYAERDEMAIQSIADVIASMPFDLKRS